MNLFLFVCVSVGNATGPYFPRARGSAGFSLALSEQFDSPVSTGPAWILAASPMSSVKRSNKILNSHAF